MKKINVKHMDEENKESVAQIKRVAKQLADALRHSISYDWKKKDDALIQYYKINN